MYCKESVDLLDFAILGILTLFAVFLQQFDVPSLCVLLMFSLNHIINRPVAQLQKKMQEISNGNFSYEAANKKLAIFCNWILREDIGQKSRRNG